MISHELELSLNLAVSEAARVGHEYVTVEHILYALLHNKSAAEAIAACGGSIRKTREDLERFFEERLEKNRLPQGQLPQPTVAFQRVIQRSVQHVRAAGKDTITGANVLISIFSERDSFAVYFLKKQNISRFDIVNYISHGISKVEPVELEQNPKLEPSQIEQPEVEFPQDDFDRDPDDQSKVQGNPLQKFAIDLCAKAERGEIDPLIGREKEIERAIHVLCRRRKNNPLFLGDAGVGKTALAEGLAQRIVQENVPKPLLGARIYSLDMGSLLAGSRFRGDFEQRLKSLLRALKKVKKGILFIDEIHTVVGAGAVSGGTMDASNLLKPVLASGELRCIGSSTFKEFRNHFETDHALARRFQKIEIDEPSVDECVKILNGLKNRYEEFHKVKYSQEGIKLAAELAAKHLRDRRLPDSAIDVIDEAGAMLSLKRKSEKIKSITADMIQETVAKMARVPPQKVSKSDKEALQDLEGKLKKVVFGQDQAIEALTACIKLSRSGISNDEKPMGNFLFAGPTGVGKTEVAKQLANILAVEFLRFDMSEYMERHAVSRLIGAPPGYVGFDQGGLLTEAVLRHPHAVLLLDEIEKAHPDMHNILLQVMDHGTLTDNNGRKADFRNIILIMTTNAGARELSTASIGFTKKMGESTGNSEAIKNAFTPEFRNRLDAIISFKPLSLDIILMVVDKFIAELKSKLAAKQVKISISDKLRRYLAKEGCDDVYGARPLARLVQEKIKKPLSDEILFGQLTKGGVVTVDLNRENQVVFDYK